MLKKKIGFVSVSVISVSVILDSVSVRFRCIGKIAFRSYTTLWAGWQAKQRLCSDAVLVLLHFLMIYPQYRSSEEAMARLPKNQYDCRWCNWINSKLYYWEIGLRWLGNWIECNQIHDENCRIGKVLSSSISAQYVAHNNTVKRSITRS